MITQDDAIAKVAKDNELVQQACALLLYIDLADNPHCRIEAMADDGDDELMALAGKSQGLLLLLHDHATQLCHAAGKRVENVWRDLQVQVMRQRHETTTADA